MKLEKQTPKKRSLLRKLKEKTTNDANSQSGKKPSTNKVVQFNLPSQEQENKEASDNFNFEVSSFNFDQDDQEMEVEKASHQHSSSNRRDSLPVLGRKSTFIQNIHQ